MNNAIEKKISCLSLSSEEKNQLKRILAIDINHVPHPDFRRRCRMAQILKQEITVTSVNRMDIEEERALFLQYNYFRSKREKIRRLLLRQAKWPKAKVLELIHYDDKQKELKDKIVTSNMGLVMSMAHRIRFTKLEYEDLVSEGNMALLKAVDHYDCSYGYRFSTYACRAILRRMSRMAKTYGRYSSRFYISFDSSNEKDNHIQQRRQEHLNDQAWAVSEIVRTNQAELTKTEMSVLEKRFSLGKGRYEPVTLKTIGQQLNLSKERIRNIQNVAIKKIRQASERNYISV